MTDQHEHRTATTAEDQAFVDGARRFRRVLRHPFAVGFVAVAGAAVLFWLGIGVGETLYDAFEGDVAAAARFAIAFTTAIAALVALGTWLDRRRSASDDDQDVRGPE